MQIARMDGFICENDRRTKHEYLELQPCIVGWPDLQAELVFDSKVLCPISSNIWNTSQYLSH